MAEQTQQVEETTVTEATPAPGSKTVTADTTVARSSDGGVTAERIIYYITGLLLTLLAFRFVLSLLGANRANGFADFIYSVSLPFAAPFLGLFGYNMQYGVARFEIETLVAMAVYALVGYGIAKMVRIARKA